MEMITMAEVPDRLSFSPYPHYDRGTIRNLLINANQWSTKFTPHVNRLLAGLAESHVWLDANGTPLISGSQVVGQVSWMEDFTLFAVHPDRDWDVDLPLGVAGCEYDLTVNCALDYTGPNAGYTDKALVYYHDQPLPSKNRADIKRAVKSCGDVQVRTVVRPPYDQLLAGVNRWNRHAMSGDYFLWQWLWASSAGEIVRVEGAGFTAWLGFVTYGNRRIFTSYLTTGDCNGMGTACLHHALDALNNTDEPDGATMTILTAPMLPEYASRYNVERYETYKRRFANGEIPVSFLSGKWGADEAPYPPYYNALTQEMIHG